MTMSHTNAPTSIIRPTKETYDRLQQAYDVLNKSLFGGELPNCLITLQRRKNTYGYFCGERFTREDGISTDEIALNPAHFKDRSLPDILATLAHDMCHLWQYHFGKAGRGRYHNRQWAEKMKEIGLQPTDTGREGGKETGDRVLHYVIAEGKFARLMTKLLARDFAVPWVDTECFLASQDTDRKDGQESKSGKRVKYVCTHDACDQKAWAKHDAQLVCGKHMAPMSPAP
ncbi:MAG: SprT-like domain-containing protein [Candidatus Thiodiazotropha sp. (ex Codakia orbicularis)]|nr:SprT-like domain-containing protein [Candidatus Thiodiazotropha sp. (ex Codakia orbicularis)]